MRRYFNAIWVALAILVYAAATAPRRRGWRGLLAMAAAALVIGAAVYVLAQTSSAIAIFAISAGTAGLAEFGDKTQLLALALTARFRRVAPVLCGMLLATLANHLLAASIGQEAMALLGMGWSRWLLLALLVGLAMWVLVPEKSEAVASGSDAGAFLAALALMFLAEFGDKTQIATVLLAAKYQAVLPVALGTTLGIAVTDGLAVLFGGAIAAWLPLRIWRWSSAAMFLALGLATLPVW